MTNWNQSICGLCWERKNGDREPVRMKPEYREEERCCMCGKPHRSGIYFRAHPDEVLYPTMEE